jgi:hypothetical protein
MPSPAEECQDTDGECANLDASIKDERAEYQSLSAALQHIEKWMARERSFLKVNN